MRRSRHSTHAQICENIVLLPDRLRPMITTVERRYSLDEYRAIARKAEGRSEYRDGEIVPILGGSLNHSRISGNTFAFLKFIKRDTQFEPINSDLRLWIPDYRRGLYPDVMVFDGEPQLNGDRRDEVLNPLSDC